MLPVPCRLRYQVLAVKCRRKIIIVFVFIVIKQSQFFYSNLLRSHWFYMTLIMIIHSRSVRRNFQGGPRCLRPSGSRWDPGVSVLGDWPMNRRKPGLANYPVWKIQPRNVWWGHCFLSTPVPATVFRLRALHGNSFKVELLRFNTSANDWHANCCCWRRIRKKVNDISSRRLLFARCCCCFERWFLSYRRVVFHSSITFMVIIIEFIIVVFVLCSYDLKRKIWIIISFLVY